jgi:hypothetical protein
VDFGVKDVLVIRYSALYRCWRREMGVQWVVHQLIIDFREGYDLIRRSILQFSHWIRQAHNALRHINAECEWNIPYNPYMQKFVRCILSSRSIKQRGALSPLLFSFDGTCHIDGPRKPKDFGFEWNASTSGLCWTHTLKHGGYYMCQQL